MQERQNIAVFVDYDNIEIGVKSTLRREFAVSLCLDALKERGDIVAKFAYANWSRQEGAVRQMAENAVQMVQRLPSPRGDKNGADINLALDALEMAFTHKNVNAFAIISGDSDFIPLVNKLKAYALQEQGMDTVDANLALGFPSENREYGAAVAMLRDLGVTSVRLLTNNPAKTNFLTDAGIAVNECLPVLVGIGEANAKYLEVKRDRMGHQIPEGNL